jgi:DNA polymerase-3 subunit gamma/tau
MPINPELVKLARYTVGRQRVKQAVQPPQQDDPSQQAGGGGAPPMDPSMMGGAGGAPMDPSMAAAAGGGGAPPADPSAGGGGPVPGGGGLTADSIRQIMMDVLGQMGIQPGMGGAGGAGGAGMKPGKPDPMAQGMDIFQIKKMLTTIMNAMGIEMPQDILDGPNRDPSTGAPMPPGAPGSTSDPSRQSPPAAGGGQGGQGGQPQSSIKPIGQLQGAFPTGGSGAGGGGGGGGGEKSGAAHLGEEESPRTSIRPAAIRNKAAALNAVLRRKSKG